MIFAAIPIKRLAEAKSRLALRLRDEQRVSLVVALARQTVAVLDGAGLDRVALVTPDCWLANELRTEWLPDRGDLNSSLAGAETWALDAGAARLLILPGDLPLLSVEHIRRLLQMGEEADVVVEPARDGGTAALLLTPPDAIQPAFGEQSFQRHLDLARSLGKHVRTGSFGEPPADLDTPEDLDLLGPLENLLKAQT